MLKMLPESSMPEGTAGPLKSAAMAGLGRLQMQFKFDARDKRFSPSVQVVLACRNVQAKAF